MKYVNIYLVLDIHGLQMIHPTFILWMSYFPLAPTRG